MEQLTALSTLQFSTLLATNSSKVEVLNLDCVLELTLGALENSLCLDPGTRDSDVWGACSLHFGIFQSAFVTD